LLITSERPQAARLRSPCTISEYVCIEKTGMQNCAFVIANTQILETAFPNFPITLHARALPNRNPSRDP
jgi:hypothetical protein